MSIRTNVIVPSHIAMTIIMQMRWSGLPRITAVTAVRYIIVILSSYNTIRMMMGACRHAGRCQFPAAVGTVPWMSVTYGTFNISGYILIINKIKVTVVRIYRKCKDSHLNKRNQYCCYFFHWYNFLSDPYLTHLEGSTEVSELWWEHKRNDNCAYCHKAGSPSPHKRKNMFQIVACDTKHQNK